jgi:hypothetical protein
MPPEGFKGMKIGNDRIAIQRLPLRLVNLARRQNVRGKLEFGREL